MRTVWSVSTVDHGTDAGRAPYAEHTTGARPVLPWWAWIIAGVAIFLAAVSGVLFMPAETGVAIWWPAAGLSVAFVLLQPRSRIAAAIVLVLVVTTVANAIAGRPLAVSLAFGVANTAEVAVVVALLGSATRRFELSTVRAGIRFAVAVVAGALAVGLLAAATVALLEGGEFWSTVGFAAASHGAAVCLIAPLAALPPPVPVAAGRVEMAVQVLLLAVVLAVVFHPSSSLPLAFAPFPLVAWAALRFPIRFVIAETALATLVMIALTLDGGGPFRREGLDMTVGAAMFETLLISFAGFAVVLSAAQYELRALTRQVRAANLLLTGSVVDARIGLVVAERDAQATRVTWANRAGRRLLADELDGERWAGPLRVAAMSALRTGEQVTVGTHGERTITVAANPIDGVADRIAVQLLDVTAMLRARQAQLEAAVERDAARAIRAELERQRDDFLVTTSHELRTPITSIVGYAELLQDGGTLSSTEQAWVRVIARNGQRLSELVEDLLTLGRGVSGAPLQIRQEAVRCAELFEEVAANLRVVTEQRRLRVRLEPGGHAVFASRGDAGRMLSNLLVNACKFTPEGGEIRLSARADGDLVLVLVEDTGPGMSADERAQAFERFYRAPGAERDNVAGTGLGLAIVAELAARNGGSVALRPAAPHGLVVELRLPAAHATRSAA